MASNFKIFSFETHDSLHLKLDGDFDGSSAHELLNTLKKYGDGFYQIFIDTNDLKAIHPFGKEVLQKKLGAFKAARAGSLSILPYFSKTKGLEKDSL